MQRAATPRCRETNALYIATMTDTPYLDRTSDTHFVYFPCIALLVLCGGRDCHHNSDVPLSHPPFFLNCLLPSFLSPSVLLCFTLSSPRIVERANYCLSPLPSSTDPHLSHTAIFPYRLGVLVHILIVYCIPHPPFCILYFSSHVGKTPYKGTLLTRLHRT